MAEWHWTSITDDLLDGLPDEAARELEGMAKELVLRESLVYPDPLGFAGKTPGLRKKYGERLLFVYLTDVRATRVVIVQVTWCG